MNLPKVPNGSWEQALPVVRRCFQKIDSLFLGIDAKPTFAEVTVDSLNTDAVNTESINISGLTASRLMATDASKNVASVSDLTAWINGTANQVIVTDDGDGTITLSTPQDIHTGATPTFANLTLSEGVLNVPGNGLGGVTAGSLGVDSTLILGAYSDAGGGYDGVGLWIQGSSEDMVFLDTTGNTITISPNSIDSSLGSISFDDNNLTTTGTLDCADVTIDSPSNIYALSHDSFADFDANEHFLQTAITNVSTGLSTGLLKVTTGTGALSVITDSSINWDAAYSHISNDGSDHSFINQGVQTTDDPYFTGIGIGNDAATPGGAWLEANNTGALQYFAKVNHLDNGVANNRIVFAFNFKDSGGTLREGGYQKFLLENANGVNDNDTAIAWAIHRGGANREVMTLNHDGYLSIAPTGQTAEVPLHIIKTDFSSSFTPDSYDVAMIENNTHCVFNICCPTGSIGGIKFSDSTSGRGYIRYNHGDDSMKLYAANTLAFGIDNSGNTSVSNKLGIGAGPNASFINYMQGTSLPCRIRSTAALGAGEYAGYEIQNYGIYTWGIGIDYDFSNSALVFQTGGLHGTTVYAIDGGGNFIAESAGAAADRAGFGQLWIKNDTPNTLMFTDDAGNDCQLSYRSRCRVTRSADQSIPTASATKVQLNQEDYDTNNEFDSSTNYRFTPAAGYYHISANVNFEISSDADHAFYVYIYKNGSTCASAIGHSGNTANSISVSVSTDIYLDGDDYIELYCYQNTGGNVNISGAAESDYAWTQFSAHRFG